MAALDLLGRRWTLRLLWEMGDRRQRTFRELQQLVDDVSPSVLNARLTELREAHLVVHDGDGYRLTELALELTEAFMPLTRWAQRWARVTQRADLSGD